MKYDLHCHTKEGSIDAQIGVYDYARKLKSLGYKGMLCTDHDTYGGYRTWERLKAVGNEVKDFYVLKGIEYDTKDGGHVICILPDNVFCPILERRGLKLELLAMIVHLYGGIIGAAHPYGNGSFAITNTRLYKKNKEIINIFDFIETNNAGITEEANWKAKRLANHYKKPQTSGSDAHKKKQVGTAYTEFDTKITCNNDLIRAIKGDSKVQIVNLFSADRVKYMNALQIKLGVVGYWVYNQLEALLNTHARNRVFEDTWKGVEIAKKEIEDVKKKSIDICEEIVEDVVVDIQHFKDEHKNIHEDIKNFEDYKRIYEEIKGSGNYKKLPQYVKKKLMPPRDIHSKKTYKHS
ncbi:hypothetical protein SAMN05216249_11842 [Acetitomaculum ruminis DSM 5522]|uniref:Polymerase/histidinol phosphatase N-terminal domain-containing protein n=1 Tax=Acetitomaculum ruminis DSM 5522 TaxID=1120918 RepID=A0A1I0ZWJ3_9FIRM|nr:PHP domain-containing protein [Acetitomaculum ruminis]SFB30124.1 hypothetical protein SAMN05216249_11842 [Acetitomaculum ruminis DSM 5522]